MFRRSVAWLLVILLCAALLFQLPLLALLCTLLLLAAGVAWVWNRYALTRLTYGATLSTATAFPDDEIELLLRVANRKPLPASDKPDVRPRSPERWDMAHRGLVAYRLPAQYGCRA